MRECSKCGRQYSDEVQFCVDCGAKTEYKQVSLGQGNNNNNNTVLIAIIVALAAILITAGIVLAVVFLNKSNSKESVQQADISANSEATSEPEQQQETDNNEANDLGIYRTYFDSIDTEFGKLVMSDRVVGEYSTYKTGLQDALAQNNADNCKYNYDKLVALQNSLKVSSQKKMNSLESKLKKTEKKSYAKSAKKKAEYKKNKKLAKTAIAKGDYVTAKTYYEACSDLLREAKAKAKKKKKKSSSRKDDWYKTGVQDNSTYQQVYLSSLSSYEVSGFSKETKRYYMNTLFAAYGYRFQNQTIQAFFNRQGWYNPDYSIAPGNQNAIKKKFDSMCMRNYHLLGGN